MSDTKNLTLLGSTETKYPTNPEEAILETFDNQHEDGIYLVTFSQPRDEFTSLCPRTGQPDVASIELIYVPNKKMIESKAFKLYLFSFRNTGEFHEDVINRMVKDLWAVLQPKYLRIFGNFAPRGGIAIKPLVERWQERLSSLESTRIEHLIRSWDTLK